MNKLSIYLRNKAKKPFRSKTDIFLPDYDDYCRTVKNPLAFKAQHVDRLEQVNQDYASIKVEFGLSPQVFDGYASSEVGRKKLISFGFLKDGDSIEDISYPVAEVVNTSIKNYDACLDWPVFSRLISIKIAAAFLGTESSDEFLDSVETLLSWLCGDDDKKFIDLPEQDRAAIEEALKAVEKEFDQLSVVMFVELYQFLSSELLQLPSIFKKEKRLLNKVYQAATVRNVKAMEALVETMQTKMALVPYFGLKGFVAEGFKASESIFGNLKAEYGDKIIFHSVYHPSTTHRPKGKELAGQRQFLAGQCRKLISAVLVELFCKHRISHFDQSKVFLKALPENPSDYKFRILGSSPPWGVGEEQAWLLDSYGIHQYEQYNVLVLEFFRLLALQRFSFYDSSAFYAAYDEENQVLLGSPFSGGGDQTIEMGEQFHTFASHLSVKGHKHAAHFSSFEHYSRIFEAYATIRRNYFTWAYFIAFLDKGYPFVLNALLINSPKPGFKPLSLFGNLFIILVVRLVGLSFALPVVKDRIRNLFVRVSTQNEIEMKRSVAEIDAVLADGRPFIFGDEFSAADIHICANLCNLIVPDEFRGGGIYAPLDQYPVTYRKGIEKFRRTATGQYVLRVYKDYRKGKLLQPE